MGAFQLLALGRQGLKINKKSVENGGLRKSFCLNYKRYTGTGIGLVVLR